MESKQVVVLGIHSTFATRAIEKAAQEAAMASVSATRVEEVFDALGDLTPACVIVSLEEPECRAACQRLRSRASFSQVPIFAVSSSVNDLSFVELFTWGADDLLPLESERIVRRLRPLARSGVSSSTAARGRGVCLIASADPLWRTVMARVLVNGGYDVRFALGSDDTIAQSADKQVSLVVTSDDLEPRGLVDSVWAARGMGTTAPWVVVAPPKKMGAIRVELTALDRVAVTDAYAPPENVLFISNELSRAGLTNNRRYPRVLYGTTVEFRIAGRDSGDLGFLYNASEGGFYVRTCAPLERGQEVWVELWPPRSERRVRLSGEVAWQRPFGPSDFATVPAGFGVKLTDGLAGDMERYGQGVRQLASMLLGDS